MQRGGIEFRRGAALHVSHFRALIDNDERALELSKVLGINPEVGLQGVLHFYARWHVNKRATAENGGVQRAEFVVARRNHFAEPFPKNLRVIL